MNRKQINLLLGLAAVLVLAVILIVVLRGDERGRGPGGDAGNDGSDGQSGPVAENWADAPPPGDDLEKLEQYRRLWPDIDDAPADREAVRQSWQDFAARYPDNIYVPNEYRGELSESERKARRETLDAVGAVESGLASARALARKSSAPGPGGAPGEGPDAPVESPVTPQEQRLFFDYKIRELESRIQIVEYTIEQNRLDADQLPEARRDLATWRAKIAEFEQVRATIPNQADE